MLGDLNTSVGTISESQLDQLFNDTPQATPNADSLVVGAKEGETTLQDSIPLVDVDDILKEKQEEEGKQETPAATVEVAKTEEDTETEKADEGQEEAVTAEVSATIGKTVEYLISKGIWKDFDGREEIEWTEELYAELAEAQTKAQVEELYTQKKAAAGDYGQAIIEYIENGGDPDQVIDLFKEQKAIQQFDISSDEAKEELISKYYKDVLGWKPDRVKRALTALHSEEDGLETEARDIKEKYDAQYREQLEVLQYQQAAARQQEEKKKKAFEDNLSKVIESQPFDDGRKSRIKSALFRFDRQLPDGQVVNELYMKFAELQNDPKQYVEFAEWVLDRENYIQRRATELANTVAEKTFKFVKGGGSKSKAPQNNSKTDSPTINFGTIQFK